MKKEICSDKLCTACGGCENVCPKSCVLREKRDSTFNMEKGDGCIECNLCQKVCPINTYPDLQYPLKAYAAWSTDQEIRKKSASGGVATTLYIYSVANDILIVGAHLDENFECHLKIGKSNEDIIEFQNSKYTYSYSDDIYKKVGKEVKNGNRVLFIGLPCQVAALKNYFNALKIDPEKLVTVDLICHGTPNPDYLKSHIRAITKKTGKEAKHCFFRDSNYRTQKFIFSLYDRNNQIYKKSVDEDDLYQIGFHNALIYKDACYSCQFAQSNRAGDLTIGDYHVKDVDECDIDIENVSLILVNNKKGEVFISSVVDNNYLYIIERPIEEPIKGEKQLRHPSVAGPEREAFLQNYHLNRDYEKSAASAFKTIVIKRRLKVDKIKLGIKKIIKFILPKKVWKLVKRKLKKND